MSLSAEAKSELCGCEISWECCLSAALSAVIHTAGALSFSSDGISVIIDTENGSVVEFVNGAVERLFGGAAILQDGKPVIKGDFVTDMLLTLKIFKSSDYNSSNPKKKGSDVFFDDSKDTINDSINLVKQKSAGLSVEEGIDPSLVEGECCKKAYLTGAFIGCGSITVLRGYHLEFSCASKRLRDGLIWLLDCFGIRAGEATRGGKHITYIKDKDFISDILALMGANKTMLKLNALLVERSVMQDVARAANCDIANLNRLVSASLIQRQAIEKLGEIKKHRLKEVAEARQKYPDLSYDELAVILGVSKSTVKYRLNKLVEMAEKSED